MSWQALEWARQQKCGKSGRKFCLIMLANYADESGSCYPRVETLAADMEAGVSTVHTYLADLEKAGLIRILIRYAKRGSRRSNRYQLLLQGPDTPMPDSEDWHYERPDPATRKQRGTGKPPESGGMPDQGDHTSESGRDGQQASKNGRHEPPESGGMNLQNLEASTNKEFNLQEEPPVGTPAGPSDRRGTETTAVQTTIDGDAEPLAGKPAPTTTQTAFGLAEVWINWWANKGTPIAASNPKHQLKALIKQFLDAGYTEDEVKSALRCLNEPIPHKAQLQRELIRARGVSTGATPQQRGAGARVNDHWDQQRETAGVSMTSAGTAAPRAERIRTEGGAW